MNTNPQNTPYTQNSQNTSINRKPRNTPRRNSTSSVSSGASAISPQTPKIPPIVLQDKDKWAKVGDKINELKITVTKARVVNEGIKIFTANIDDYRSLSKYLTKKEYNFHTYSIESELNLKIVLSGLPESLYLQLVENDLCNKNFNPIKITRMLKRDTGPMPLVIVELPKQESNIYNIQKCVGLNIRVERLKKPNQMGQCFNCQTFGLSQRNCHAQPKCVKYAGLHPSQDCPQPKTIIAKCTN